MMMDTGKCWRKGVKEGNKSIEDTKMGMQMVLMEW